MSDSEYVNLENAKALKELGFPQNGLQMRYSKYSDGSWVRGIKLEYEGIRAKRLAAPTHLRALEWLEEDKRWRWARYIDGKYYATQSIFTESCTPVCSTPDELISAILAHLEKS